MDGGDAIAFPVLAGSAITQFFGFGYAQLSEILKRRRERRSGETGQHPEWPIPAELEPVNEPLTLRNDVAMARSADLQALHDRLSRYCGLELDGSDPSLRRDLADLRTALEQLFGTRLVFRGEHRAEAGIQVDQGIQDLHGSVVALQIGSAESGVEARVGQRIGTVHPGGEAVGIRIDRLG